MLFLPDYNVLLCGVTLLFHVAILLNEAIYGSISKNAIFY